MEVCINGQWHHITDKYINQYLNEFTFRYEHRDNKNRFDLTIDKALGL